MNLQHDDSAPAFEIAALDVGYGSTPAVHNFNLKAKAGQHISLVGPSGCGKTTILRSIAGLETPSAGRISLFGRTVFDAAKKINVPTERREVSMMFQSYAIWPHMTVFENVSYGLRLRNVPTKEVDERVRWALDLVGMSEFIDREAPKLSGGQQQRVALARSFVFNPKILLFDEPLSNLDARLRSQMRIELKQLTRRLGITSLYVTHDQEEALSLSDVVVVLDKGIVKQLSDPLTAYFRPANTFVSEFMGAANHLAARSRGAVADFSFCEVELANGEMIKCSGTLPKNALGTIAIKLVHLRIESAKTGDNDESNSGQCSITDRMFVGDFVEYTLDWRGLSLRCRELSTRLLEIGQVVQCSFKTEHAVLLSDEASQQ